MNTYFDRYAYPGKLFDKLPNHSLNLSVVIPCFNEPDIISALESLNSCIPVPGTEVIIIINESEHCSAEISNQNKNTLADIERWLLATNTNFDVLVHYLIAPAKDAGVGFARKVGMDEAARRFEQIDNKTGVICCFDADSTCSDNYLQSVYQHFFTGKTKPNAAAIYFEHPIPEDKHHGNGIMQYELHLRYYVQALRFIGYPFAHHTVGSSMVVRSDIYQKVGGMNKRKAGEDFYFLHRVMPTGDFIDITDTAIYPSPRVSTRVPFGTGKAMEKWSEHQQQDFFTYNLKSFLELKEFFRQVSDFYQIKPALYDSLLGDKLPAITHYLEQISFSKTLNRLQKQSSTPAQFSKNWYLYFDGFRVLKFLHFARDSFYPDQPVVQEAQKLASQYRCEITSGTHIDFWLSFYRKNDQQGLP